MPSDPTFLVPGTQAVAEAGRSLTERRYGRAHAYRDGEMVCGRVELTVRADMRLGLTPRERRCVSVRFLEHLDPALRAELAELVSRRGVIARRAAERIDPVEIVLDDPRLGRERIVGRVQPPQRRHGSLHEIEFGLREPGP